MFERHAAERCDGLSPTAGWALPQRLDSIFCVHERSAQNGLERACPLLEGRVADEDYRATALLCYREGWLMIRALPCCRRVVPSSQAGPDCPNAQEDRGARIEDRG